MYKKYTLREREEKMKLNLKERMKQEKGITLIALVITIIVLLILAGVTIAALTGENGILNQANKAKIKSDIAEVKEKAQLDIANWTAEKLKNGEDTTLNDATVKSIIESANQNNTNKYYSELTDTSIMTKQGNEILFSEFYKGVDYSELCVGDYVSNYPVQYENVDSYVEPITGEGYGLVPKDCYTGWRVLSVEREGDAHYVKLVSAGIPLNFYYKTEWNISSWSAVYDLTVNFFNNSIKSNCDGNYSYPFFRKCGFKDAFGHSVERMATLKELFSNPFTDFYEENETAEFFDEYFGEEHSNSNVTGHPKVRALSLQDMSRALGFDAACSDIGTNDLFCVPCKEVIDEYGETNVVYSDQWLANSADRRNLYRLGGSHWVNRGHDCVQGVRVVVSLKSNVKFTPAANNINDTQTWNISM